jgi:HlyD family secretion protein
MTATVEFLVSSAQNVLKVANAALRYQPPAEARAAAPARPAVQQTARVAQRGTATRSNRPKVGTLWREDSNGKLEPVRVRTGLTDGQFTEVSGENLTEDMTVVVGESSGTTQSTTANPFQSQQRGPGPGGPPRGF